jgi:hypothetical protein
MSRDREQDNVINIKGPKEAEIRNKRMKKMLALRRRLMAGVVVCAVILAIVLGIYISNREYKGYKVISSADTVYETNAEYKEFGGNLLKYTPDGVSYINANGDTVWTAGCDMKVPIAETNGNYAVVADKGGNTVREFNTEGAVSEVTMPYTICDIDVGSQGAFTVILESDETNYINMYSSTGEQIYTMQTSIDKSGYPVDMSISDDGQKLVTSYFFMEGVDTKMNLAAYNFGEVGQNSNADRIVGGYVFEDELIPKVEFISNDVVAAFSDSHIYIYAMKEKPSKQAEITYDNEIQSIFYSEKFVGTVEKNSDAEGETYLMKVYDLRGNQEFTYPFSLEYDNIYATQDEIIITGGAECLIVSAKGKTKFSYAFDTRIKNMIPATGSRKYIITFDNRTETIKLKSKDTKEN